MAETISQPPSRVNLGFIGFIEGILAWPGNFRRLVARCDRSLMIYRGFFQIACFMTVLRRVINRF